MKYLFHKQALSALLCAVLCICLTLSAFAEDVPENGETQSPAFTLGVTAFQQSEHTTVDLWWDETDGVFYLFLPSQCDPAASTVRLTGTDFVLVDGVTVADGAAAGIFTVGEHSFSYGDRSYRLQVLQSANLPAVFLETASGSLAAIQADKSHAEAGSVTVIADGELSIDNAALKSVKGRGNSTWGADKKPYNIKFEKKTDVLGMGKAKKWSLLANHFDDTLLRNSLALDLAAAFGLAYTSEYRMVDLYANGEYQGNYLIVESVEIGETRVAVTDLEDANEKANPGIDTEKANKQSEAVEGQGSRKWVGITAPDDVTGGYLLEAEMQSRYGAEVSGFVTGHGQHIVLKSPEYAAKEEVDYIADLYGEMEQALYAPDGRNAKGNHYTDYFDMDQLVKMYILTEYTFHRDAGMSSCYFYKDAGESVFHAGPAWDFDLSLGNTRYAGHLPFDVTNAESWWANSLFYRNTDQQTQTVFTLLYRHEDFRALVAEQWSALSQTVAAALEQLPRMIDETAPSAVMNGIRWNLLTGSAPEEKEESFRRKADRMAQFAAARRTALDKGFGPDAAMVYYDANGGSGQLFNSTMLNVGETVTLPDINDNVVMTMTVPENCVFAGWSTQPDGSGERYEPYDTAPVTQKTAVFYAQWETVAPKEPKPPLKKDTYFALGDIDLNGAVEAADARLALRASVHLEETDEILLRLADADGDKQLTSADARLILRAAVKLEFLPTRAVLVRAGYVSKV